jgi:Fe-S-cluster containining protein
VHPSGPVIPVVGFTAWREDVLAALHEGRDSLVECGSCTACCRSGQFVHIAPDETEALAAIPAELRFPAPGMPKGHVVLGYDEQGRCPMLGETGCTIYEHRPRTCRVYDCRVFAAAGVEPDEDQPLIRERVAAWRFEPVDAEDAAAREAATRAAAALVAWRDRRSGDGSVRVPRTALQVAVRAVELAPAFAGGADPDDEELADLLRAEADGPGRPPSRRASRRPPD